VLERIVAEEREAKGKMPRYPGLERWTLLEKMGDGAFSNVYRARDTTGQWGEVAIKVVRKFEMNSQQVSIALTPALNCPFFCVVIPPHRITSKQLRRF
jgi:serine/threonine protein kinase